MPKKITYIQCDCKKGKLNIIAKTQVWAEVHEGVSYESTTILKCDGCDKIFIAESGCGGVVCENIKC